MELDGERTREELLTTAPVGFYRVTDDAPRVVSAFYRCETDTFEPDVTVVTVARVRMGGQLPLTGECYQEGERQVIFAAVPIADL